MESYCISTRRYLLSNMRAVDPSVWYAILTVEYGGNENIHIITSDIPLYFVMRCEASNDKIQWNIGYISWPKGMKYIAKMNEWMIPNTIFLTSRIKIWIHTEWSEQSRGPAKAACGPGPRFLWGMLRKLYEESFTSLFLPGNDVNI